jgi:hypothetical protein
MNLTRISCASEKRHAAAGCVMGFGRRPNIEGDATGTGAVVRKPPRKEPAGDWAGAAVPRYGDLAVGD